MAKDYRKYKRRRKPTKTDNKDDARERDRYAYGERQHLAKLTDERVREMRRLYASGGLSFTAIGRLFGVSRPNAAYVIKGQTWKHVEG